MSGMSSLKTLKTQQCQRLKFQCAIEMMVLKSISLWSSQYEPEYPNQEATLPVKYLHCKSSNGKRSWINMAHLDPYKYPLVQFAMNI